MHESDWKQMYLTLVSGIVDATNLMPVILENAPVQERLNKALRDAEEFYVAVGKRSRRNS